MLKNYLIIAWRNLKKSKFFSLINILGLTIGITVCMMIFLFIMNEFNTDKFHKNKDHIYRVMRSYAADQAKVPYLSGPYATALLNDFPADIQQAVRIMPSNGLVTFQDNSFLEKNIYLADSTFFMMFTFPMLTGDAATALKEPGSVVLSESTARKFFGRPDEAMGKVIEFDKSLQLKVTAIAKDVPSNSHLQFDMVVPLSNYYKYDWFGKWINNNNFTYVKLSDKADRAALEKKFPAFVEKYMGKELANYGMHAELSLMPLAEVYFDPDSSSFDQVKHGDKKVVYIFLSIAILVLLIACINFMNLSTIRAVERSKEVGMRKVMGAMRGQLIWQFIGESMLLTAISCLLAVGLLQVAMPFYNELLDHPLSVSWTNPSLYLFLVGVILVVGLLAGSYPAFFLSAFSPIQSLKGKLRLGKGGSFFRQGLVVVQFSISVFLIVGTIIIMQQMSYVKNKELGYQQDQTVVMPIDNNDFYQHLNTFKHELESDRNIASVSAMSGEPGGFFDEMVFQVEGRDGQTWNARTEFADFEYVKTLGLKIIAGRDFSPQFATDSTESVLINRTAATKLGWTPEQALGKWMLNTVRDNNIKRRVVGVVEDFHFLSLKENMDALVISTSEDRRVALVKLKGGSTKQGLATIKAAYARVAPQYPLTYNFLNDQFDRIYKNDLRQQQILGIFSGLAIFIACLGLFGLASFAATKRTKEIGVRKVLGSSTENIVVLLSKDLLKPVILAMFIALPAGYYAMHNWLESFAYRTPMHWWIFALAAIVTFLVALLTVCFKAMRAAMANPVRSLRTE